ncbi:MAG TPA: hypothetical protein VG963_19400, partial [Polyangiaceae bacterium]|nr:hypothetical protein [Polyangiaceae bacterium]
VLPSPSVGATDPVSGSVPSMPELLLDPAAAGGAMLGVPSEFPPGAGASAALGFAELDDVSAAADADVTSAGAFAPALANGMTPPPPGSAAPPPDPPHAISQTLAQRAVQRPTPHS